MIIITYYIYYLIILCFHRMEQSLSSQSKDALIYRSVEMIDRDLDIILSKNYF